MPDEREFKVNATNLNLRSEPRVSRNNLIATLSLGDRATKIAEDADAQWWRVATEIQGVHVEGFVSHRFLVPADKFDQPAPQSGVREVHLKTGNKIARNQTSGRAFPLNEVGQPTRNGGPAAVHTAELISIIKWLNVEQSKRYKPANGSTFCNIYAFDYCHLANTYIPRVWWTRKAIATLAAGGSVAPVFGVTVSELNANSIFNWLEEFGRDFGWVRTFDMTDLQNAANAGQVGIICAQRRELNRPGHIVAVAPENGGHQATRRGGQVTVPLQSQAGVSNFDYGGKIWWTGSQFGKFGFWKHV